MGRRFLSGLARTAGGAPVACANRGSRPRGASSGEVARSSFRRLPAWGRGGSGLSLVVSIGFRVLLPVPALCQPIATFETGSESGGRATPWASAQDGAPSFPGNESRNPLNINAGSHPQRKGTRLNGRFRKPGRIHGAVEARFEQASSSASGDDQSPPLLGRSVKTVERYPRVRQGSIPSYPPFGGQPTTCYR